jgi:hypothetical protein
MAPGALFSSGGGACGGRPYAAAMDTPATDRAIAWIRTMRTLGEEDGPRIAAEFAALAAPERTAAVHGFLREIERFTFGPDQSRIGQAASAHFGDEAWAQLRRQVHAVRQAVAAEMVATQRNGEDRGGDAEDRGGADEPR